MPKFQIDWSLTARGVAEVEAVDEQDAEELLGMIPTDRLIESADRFDFETEVFPIKTKENE